MAWHKAECGYISGSNCGICGKNVRKPCNNTQILGRKMEQISLMYNVVPAKHGLEVDV